MIQKTSSLSLWRFAIPALILIMLLAVPVAAGSLAGTAWPKFQQNSNNTGQSPSDGPQTNTVAWTFAAAGSNHLMGQATVGPEGTVYFGGPDTSLYAVNPDGSLRWTYATMAKIQNAPAVGSDGTIYFGSFNADKNVYALNPDGTLKWNHTLNNGVEWSSVAIADDGTLYIGDYSGYLYALNPDGTRKWVYSSGRAIASTPAIGPDGTIYFSNKKAGGFNIYALDPDGTRKWYFATAAAVDSSLSIGFDGTLYVASHNGKVFALNPDGTKKWEISINGYLYATPAVSNDGTLYVGSSTKYMKAINPDGTLKWSALTGGVIQGSAVIGADGTLYFGCGDNRVYALNPDGSQKWTYLTGGAVYATPSIGADGTLYVGSDDLNLYAFRDPVPPVADFTSDVQTGIAPLTVTFTDLSTNTPTSWAWDFGDGGSSPVQNPGHEYTAAGVYTVTLTATNQAGSDDEMKTDYIIVERALIPLPGCTDPPTDPDGDGVHEDLNGNGRLDFADVVLFFSEMNWIAENEPVAAFDLNGNGRIDFADIVALFNEI